jgi:hypothetical protein
MVGRLAAQVLSSLICASTVTAVTGFHNAQSVRAGCQAVGVVINEVLYDPDGPDSGREFVEIINAGVEPVSLGQWTLLAGDGARPGAWTAIWQGSPAESLRSGQIFLIAEDEVEGADDYAHLALQNGPDCCALALGGVRVDVVGWGRHEHSEYYEGDPASEIPSGHSLARWPDGNDTDDNSLDFVDCPRPTPGRRNALQRDLTFGPIPIETYPINPEAFESVTISATVANVGLGDGGADQFTLLVRARDTDGDRPLMETAIPSVLAPGDTAVLRPTWEGAADGSVAIEATIVFDGDEDTTGNDARAQLRVGAGPVVVNEIMYDPDEGGEWIEIFNRSPDFQDLRGWSLFDKSGTRLTMPTRSALAAGGYLVVAQDSASFVKSFPGVSIDSVIGSYGGRWPSLNNSNGPDGVADVVSLTDADGLLSDRAVYSEGYGGGRGTSLERVRADLVGGRSDNWCASGGLGGTTAGKPNSVRAGAAGGGSLSLEPSLIDTRGTAGPAAINYCLPYRPARLTIAVYSMGGHEVIRLIDRKGGASKGTVLWDGRGRGGQALAAGAYVLLLAAEGLDGQATTAKAVAVLR